MWLLQDLSSALEGSLGEPDADRAPEDVTNNPQDNILGGISEERVLAKVRSSPSLRYFEQQYGSDKLLIPISTVRTLMCDDYIVVVMGRMHCQEVRFGMSKGSMSSAP